MRKKFKAVLAYDGAAYRGFQRLNNTAMTIQGQVEAVLSQIADEPVSIVGAGRTDSGVHASGQVIAFEMPTWPHDPLALRAAMNALLPTDIAVLQIDYATAEFHPRYSATRREYRYLLALSSVRHPLLARTHWQVRISTGRNLGHTVERMNEAAAMLVGVHDFASFGTPPKSGATKTTVRQVLNAAWCIEAEQWGAQVASFTIAANAFLYHQVRATVAALVDVGLHRMSTSEFSQRFQAARRVAFTKLAPPQGLTLVAVEYGTDADKPTLHSEAVSGETPAGETDDEI